MTGVFSGLETWLLFFFSRCFLLLNADDARGILDNGFLTDTVD